MAKEITDKQYNALVAELKKNPGNSERHYSEKSGIPQGQIGSVLYKAEVEADPSLKLPATGASVKKAREAGVRWPRIAARTGKSVAEVKRLYEEHTGEKAAASWTGRGRRTFDGATGGSGSKKTSSRSSGPRSGTSGRRGAATKTASTTTGRGRKTASAPAGRGSRGTRGTRASASDPK